MTTATLALALILASSAEGAVYVDIDATGDGTGLTWENAFTSIRVALTLPDPQEIWVAEGVYEENIHLSVGHALLGGFAGNETFAGDRNPAARRTVIQGSGNRSVVILTDGADGGALDGFTITGGNAQGASTPSGEGGGVMGRTGVSDFQISNCVIEGNTANLHGGGIAFVGFTLRVSDCVIRRNRARVGGGGLYVRSASEADIQGTWFYSNICEDTGGGVRSDGDCVLTDCVLSDNTAERGGGIGRNATGVGLTVADCLIAGNSAGLHDGGGFHIVGPSENMTQCLFLGNWATGEGGGGYLELNGSMSFVNCAFADNYCGAKGSAIAVDEGNPSLLNGSLVGNGRIALTEAAANANLSVVACHFDSNADGAMLDNGDAIYDSGAEINQNVSGAALNIDGPPRFTMNGPEGLGGLWTAPPSFDPSTGLTRLTDANAAFTPKALVGRSMNPNLSQWRRLAIAANTATSVWLTGDARDYVLPGSAYRLDDFRPRLSSPLRNAGQGDAALPGQDFDGGPRVLEGAVDIGPYETEPAPFIVSAVLADSDGDGRASMGESIILTMSQPVIATPGLLSAGDFFTAVEGDSLGPAGFAVEASPDNARQLVLTLGETPSLTLAGVFDPSLTSPNAPSGIDLEAGYPSQAIMSLTGAPAVDTGTPGVNDSGVDVAVSCVGGAATIGPLGGEARVADAVGAAYRRHAVAVAPGTLSGLIELRIVPTGEGDTPGAVKIEVIGDAPSPFPARLALEYRAEDIDPLQSPSEGAMKVCRRREIVTGVFDWVPVSGEHTVDSPARTVTVDVADLTGSTRAEDAGIWAVLPGETVQPTTQYIAPGAGRVTIAPPKPISRLADLEPPGGDYTLHRISIPNYEFTIPSDPDRIEIALGPASLAQRYSDTGQSFPALSSALFSITTRDAGGSPIAFTDPVDVRVQFMDGDRNGYDDLYSFDGVRGPAPWMRVARDTLAGLAVDFRTVEGVEHLVDTMAGAVEVRGVTDLTGSDGVGVWGATIVPGEPARAISHWLAY